MLRLSNRLGLVALFASFTVAAVAAQVPSACAAEGQAPETAEATSYASVTGIARLERRHTLTPYYCTIDGCAKPKPYWALVLQSDGERYEVDQEFALGQNAEPQFIQFGTTVIRPGARVVVVARIEALSRGYSILADVQSIRVALDTGAAASDLGDLPLDLERANLEGAPFFGWSCRSVNEPRPVYVDVEQISRRGNYAMRILSERDATDGTSLRTLASFGHVSLQMTSSLINFAGDVRGLHAELDIDQRGGRLNNLDSVLRMRGSMAGPDAGSPATPDNTEVPVDTSVKLVCDRTR